MILNQNYLIKTILIFLTSLNLSGSLFAQWQTEYPVYPLTTGEWNDTKPTFSTESQEIIFVSNRHGRQGLYSLSLKDNDVKEIYKDSIEFVNYTIHKKNGQLLAVSKDGLGYWIGSEGKATAAKAINKRAYKIESLGLNTTGTLLCFIGKRENSLYPTLFTYDRKYDNINPHFGKQKGMNNPNWSPKSEYIIYDITNQDYKTSHLEIRRWDGSYITEIKADSAQLKDANWGVSSTKFICVARTASYHYLFLMQLDGTLKEVILRSEKPLSHPDWSDDGTKIVVVMEGEDQKSHLLLIDLQTFD